MAGQSPGRSVVDCSAHRPSIRPASQPPTSTYSPWACHGPAWCPTAGVTLNRCLTEHFLWARPRAECVEDAGIAAPLPAHERSPEQKNFSGLMLVESHRYSAGPMPSETRPGLDRHAWRQGLPNRQNPGRRLPRRSTFVVCMSVLYSGPQPTFSL